MTLENSDHRHFLFALAAAFLLAGCASPPDSRILGNQVIARGTPIALRFEGSLGFDDQFFDDKLLLVRKLKLFGFAPITSGHSDYWVSVRMEGPSPFRYCIIDLMEGGTPLVSVAGKHSPRDGDRASYLEAVRLFESALYDNRSSGPAIVFAPSGPLEPPHPLGR